MIDRASQQLLRVIEEAPKFIQEIQERISAAFAPNWRGLTDDELEGAWQLTDLGLCVIWVPRAEIVRELAMADQAERSRILIKRKDEILQDIERCLDEVNDPGLSEPKIFAMKAMRALSKGEPEAAQALTAAVLTNIIHTSEYKKFPRARQQWQRRSPMEVEMSVFRSHAVLWAFARAIEDKPVPPSTFSRHASAGHVDDLAQQLTEPNALASLMLLTAILRELHFLLTLPNEAAGAGRP